MTELLTAKLYRDVVENVRHNKFVARGVAGVLTYSILFDRVSLVIQGWRHVQVVPSHISYPEPLRLQEPGRIRQAVARTVFEQLLKW